MWWNNSVDSDPRIISFPRTRLYSIARKINFLRENRACVVQIFFFWWLEFFLGKKQFLRHGTDTTVISPTDNERVQGPASGLAPAQRLRVRSQRSHAAKLFRCILWGLFSDSLLASRLENDGAASYADVLNRSVSATPQPVSVSTAKAMITQQSATPAEFAQKYETIKLTQYELTLFSSQALTQHSVDDNCRNFGDLELANSILWCIYSAKSSMTKRSWIHCLRPQGPPTVVCAQLQRQPRPQPR